MKMRSITTAAVVLGVAGVAAADTVDLRYTGPGAGQSYSINAGGSNSDVFAGQLNFLASDGTGAGASLNGTLRSFCIDVLEPLAPFASGAQTYDLNDLADAPVTNAGDPAMGAAKADAIARMYTFAAGQQFGASSDYAAAFQLAVWEVIADFDTTLDLGDGDFEVTSAVSTSVSDIVDDLFGAAADLSISEANVGALTNRGLQDQIYQVVIPLPGAAGLAAVGLAGVGLVGRRRKS